MSSKPGRRPHLEQLEFRLLLATYDNHLTNFQNLDANLGGSPALQFYKADEDLYRPLIKFDLPAIAEGATVEEARIELYHFDGLYENQPMNVTLYALSRDWVEGDGTDYFNGGEGSSWRNFDTGMPWATPGGDMNTSFDFGHGPNGIISTDVIPRFVEQGWLGFDVTAAARAWLSGTLDNYGVAFVINNGDYSEHVLLASEYADDPSLTPRLVIRTSGGEADRVAPVGTLDAPDITAGGEIDYRLTVSYSDNVAVAVSSLDSSDLLVTGPRGDNQLAELITVDFNSDGTPRVATYRAAAPGGNWDNTDNGSYLVSMQMNEVVDTSGNAVDAGNLGSFSVNVPGGSNPTDTIIDLSVRNSLNAARTQVPLSWSVPLGIDDNITNVDQLRLLREGQEVSAQFTPLSRWGAATSDDSKPLAWVLVDAQVDLTPLENAAFTLTEGEPNNVASPLQITRNDAAGVTVDTGAAIYQVSRESFRLFDSVVLTDGTLFGEPAEIKYRGQTESGPAEIDVEHLGSNRISLLVRGNLLGTAGQEDDLTFTARLHFYRDLAEVKVDLRVENLKPAKFLNSQPQANDLGSANSVVFNDLSIVLPATEEDTYTLPQGELGGEGVVTGSYSDRLLVFQGSSGDANWAALQDFAPRLQSGVTQRASTLDIDGAVTDGPNQIAGWLDANGITVAVERAWQNFPKAFRAAADTVEIGIFPGEFALDHQLRAGEAKTHTLWIRHHPADAVDIAMRARSFGSRLRLASPPDDLARTLAAGFLAPRMESEFPDYELGVDYQIARSPEWAENEAFATTVQNAISLSQSYGYLDYGDVPVDFEQPTSPYNLKYDALRGMIVQALRSGSDDWWELASSGARHAADIDIHHSNVRGYEDPRGWWEGGMYGHGYHDEDSRWNPHRNYLNPTAFGAGPAGGMLLWSMVSGDTLVLESAMELVNNLFWRTTHSDYVQLGPQATIASEVGLQRCLNFDCSGYDIAGTSRSGAHVVKAMIGAFQATGDMAYLDLVADLAEFWQRYETEVLDGQITDRFHFQTLFIRNLGHYVLLRRRLGLPHDQPAIDLIQRRMQLMTTTLWDDDTNQLLMTYDGSEPFPIDDNWQLAAADAFAVGGLILDQAQLIDFYGRSLFESASPGPAWSANAYHFTKEFVNQVGYGNYFLHAWNEVRTNPSYQGLVVFNRGLNLAQVINQVEVGEGSSLWIVDPDEFVDTVRRVSPVESASSLMPSWSPHFERIVFVSNRENDFVADPTPLLDIWTVSPDGSDLRRLTEGTGHNWTPAWSPDGRTIAFASTRRAQPTAVDEVFSFDIYVMDADGSNQRLLFDGGGQDEDPVFSADSQTVYFVSYQSDGFEIWEAPLDGGPAVPLTAANGNPILGEDISLSVDGQKLYFWNGRLNTLDLTTRQITELSWNAAEPWIGPVDRRFVFIEDFELSTGGDVAISNVDGSNVRQLTSSGDAFFARWAAPIPPANLDFGDAPDTGSGTSAGNYNTLFTDGGPSHVIVSGLTIGTNADGETDAIQSLWADGDDSHRGDDEDGLTDPKRVLIQGTSPNIQVGVTNTTGAAATLYGWIDYNGDGVFANTTERAATEVPDGSLESMVTLAFPAIPNGSFGWTYARLRLSTDVAAADPVGSANDGEVEDYRIAITGPGDSNLDGRVSFADFLRLQNGFNQPGSWGEGDFNFDGNVTFADFLILQNQFNDVYFIDARPAVALRSEIDRFHEIAGADLNRKQPRIGDGKRRAMPRHHDAVFAEMKQGPANLALPAEPKFAIHDIEIGKIKKLRKPPHKRLIDDVFENEETGLMMS